MKLACTCILILVLLHPLSSEAGTLCPPQGHSKQQLLDLKLADFEITEPAQRNATALALLSCVGDPDPAIRDGVVFEGLSAWLRQRALEPATIQALLAGLEEQLACGSDLQGFLQPFAALNLSEVARADRVEAIFTGEQRQQLVNAASTYLAGVTDYRGFSDEEGWRHGVAHGSDLVLQLVLNEQINATQVDQLITSVFQQAAPGAGIFYIHGESNRLARAVFYAYQREVVDEKRWNEWINEITDPAPLNNWNEAYSTEMGLARRHNTLAFLMAIYVYASSSEDAHDKVLASIALNALGKLW